MNYKDLRFGELKIVDRMFLGREELSREQQFLIDKCRLLLSLGGQGIFSKNDFKLQNGVLSGTISMSESLAIDKDGNIIHKIAETMLAVPRGINWLTIQKETVNWESGLVSIVNQIDTTGNVTVTVVGQGTEFKKLLRGTSSSKQVKIEFAKASLDPGSEFFHPEPINNGTYVVQNVTDDEHMTIVRETRSGAVNTAIEESNLVYRIIGSFSQDVLPTDPESDRYIYSNYGCIIKAYQNAAWPGAVNETTEFLIAKIDYTGSYPVIEDKRQTFYVNLFEFFQPQEWIQLDLRPGFQHDLTSPLSIRYSHFRSEIEIAGSFTSNLVDPIITTVPIGFIPAQKRYFECVRTDTNDVVLLCLDTAGQLKKVNNSQQFAASLQNNDLISKTVSIL